MELESNMMNIHCICRKQERRSHHQLVVDMLGCLPVTNVCSSRSVTFEVKVYVTTLSTNITIFMYLTDKLTLLDVLQG